MAHDLPALQREIEVRSRWGSAPAARDGEAEGVIAAMADAATKMAREHFAE